MARKKEYNKDDVLKAATNVFWEKGFKGTSVSDLVAATGLNKHSMYEVFGNKEGLFKECLLTYANEIQKETLDLLTKKPLGIDNIKAFLLNRINYSLEDNFMGCMVINSAAQKEMLEFDAFELIKTLLESHIGVMEECFKNAQLNGEIDSSKDPNMLARYVMNFSAGIMVVGKTGQEKEQLLDMLEIFMTTFNK